MLGVEYICITASKRTPLYLYSRGLWILWNAGRCSFVTAGETEGEGHSLQQCLPFLR